jgi:diacylglycerol kinase (ATP)
MIAIVNPEAAGGRAGREWRRLAPILERRYGPMELRETRAPEDPERFVREAAVAGEPRVVVAGGDGTLGEAVNGLAEDGGGELLAQRPEIVFVPLGSGGDFARTAGFSGRSREGALQRATPRAIDLGRLTVRAEDGGERTRLFANIASAGLSADIADRANRGAKRFGGAFAFRLATLAGLAAWRDRPFTLTLDGREVGGLEASIVAVANGRYFGSGLCIAPGADPSSGRFEVAVLRGATLGLFLRHGGKLQRGEHTRLPQFSRFEAKVVEIAPLDPARPLRVEADGECPGFAPARAELLPGAAVIVAPW